MALDPASRVRVNLEKASVLLLDDNALGMSILVQIITGLGARHLHRCGSVEQARETVSHHEVDLAIVDGMAPDGGGYDFVRWLRTEAGEPNAYAPVIVTTSHTPSRDVTRARDCGGHIIIKKPISPIVMLERILWVSKNGRAFLYADDYVGPDRRFRTEDAPGGAGRRREDCAANDAVPEAAEATAPEAQEAS